MLGRKTYTREEVDQARSAIDRQLAVYKRLAAAHNGPQSELEDFEAPFFNTMALALDRYFVHRLRVVTGKDGNPLNEVELICDALVANNGVFRAGSVIKYVAGDSVVKLAVGDQVNLTADAFERLSAAFFDDLERKFLGVPTP